MKTAVAYARYSSDNQRQESIDAQVRAIKEYCKKNEIFLIHTYVDEAVSATSDQREEFLRMVEDAKNGTFQLCIVHKLVVSRGTDMTALSIAGNWKSAV